MTWRCERTRAKLGHFPLAFCATAAVDRAACWQRQQQALLWVHRHAFYLHGLQLRFKLGSEVKMFRLILQAILQNCWVLYWWSYNEGIMIPCNRRLFEVKTEVLPRKAAASCQSFQFSHTVKDLSSCGLQVTASSSILLGNNFLSSTRLESDITWHWVNLHTFSCKTDTDCYQRACRTEV